MTAWRATGYLRDLDNIAKLVADALNPDGRRGLRGVWCDDHLVHAITARLVRKAGAAAARTEVTVRALRPS